MISYMSISHNSVDPCVSSIKFVYVCNGERQLRKKNGECKFCGGAACFGFFRGFYLIPVNLATYFRAPRRVLVNGVILHCFVGYILET